MQVRESELVQKKAEASCPKEEKHNTTTLGAFNQ